MTQHWYVDGARVVTPPTGDELVPGAWETDGGPPIAPVHEEGLTIATPDPRSNIGAPYTREFYRFSRRGFHIDYFDDAEPVAPPPWEQRPLLTVATTAGRSTHHLQAVVRQGRASWFTVAQDVVGPGESFWAGHDTKGLDGALRREVVRLIRTSEGRPGGSYRLKPMAYASAGTPAGVAAWPG